MNRLLESVLHGCQARLAVVSAGFLAMLLQRLDGGEGAVTGGTSERRLRARLWIGRRGDWPLARAFGAMRRLGQRMRQREVKGEGGTHRVLIALAIVYKFTLATGS